MTVAWTALLTWPLVPFILFRVLSPPAALAASILGGYLFLPEVVHYKIPGLPVVDKPLVVTLAAFVAAFAMAPRAPEVRPPGFVFPRSKWGMTLLALLLLGLVGTYLTNGDVLPYRGRMLPPLPVADLPQVMLEMFIFLLPFLLGRRYLATEAGQVSALKVLVFFGMVYSLLALFEVRMSPQLNNWVYGFFPHSFLQHMRSGGFRPIVFLNHGLWLSIFIATATLAAVGLARMVGKEQKTIFILSAVWLYGTLYMTKSLGAFLITTLLVAMWLLLPRRMLMLGLTAFIVVVLSYPLLRTFDLVPVEWAVDMASRINADRAGSLDFRVRSEDGLLAHAKERALFGWGQFGRNLAAEVQGMWNVIPDGYWVIVFGVGGYARYLSEFGLLTMGVLALALGRREAGPAAVTVAVLLTANLIDLLPNATMTMLTLLWAGALAGRMEIRETGAARAGATTPAPDPRRVRYSRADAQTAPYRRSFPDRTRTRK